MSFFFLKKSGPGPEETRLAQGLQEGSPNALRGWVGEKNPPAHKKQPPPAVDIFCPSIKVGKWTRGGSLGRALPFATSGGGCSSELMCCGFACLRLDMVHPHRERNSSNYFLLLHNKFLELGNYSPGPECACQSNYDYQ